MLAITGEEKMYISIDINRFRDAFRKMGREDQFTYNGLEVLFDGLEQYEADADEKMELDVISLCCNFSEMTAEEIKNNYQLEIDEEEDFEKQVDDFISDNTWVLGMHETDGIKYYVFQQF